MNNVNRYTRAGRDGKVITCPYCMSSYPVYHFSWSALVCQECKRTVEKYDYLLYNSTDTCIEPFIPTFHD